MRVAQVGMVCVAVTMFMFRFPTKFGGLAALMVLLALFSTPFSSVGEGLIARMAHRNGFNYGAMRLWGSFGFAVTALICGFVWDRLGFKTMYLISAVLFVVPIVVIGFVEEGPVIPAHERRPARTLLLDRGLLLLLVGVVLSSIANSLSGTFSGIFVRSLGGSNLFVGAMWAISAMAELPTMFYSNRISDKIGETAALLTAYAVMGLSFLGYSLVRDPTLLLVLCATKGNGLRIVAHRHRAGGHQANGGGVGLDRAEHVDHLSHGAGAAHRRTGGRPRARRDQSGGGVRGVGGVARPCVRGRAVRRPAVVMPARG